jgi:hypothetical protein
MLVEIWCGVEDLLFDLEVLARLYIIENKVLEVESFGVSESLEGGNSPPTKLTRITNQPRDR